MRVSMSEPRNLVLDVDEAGGSVPPRLRIAVGEAWAFTRHGGAPTVSRDCGSLAAFEREVGRLKQELDVALAEARGLTGQSARVSRGHLLRRSRGRASASFRISTPRCASGT
jgi:hypothetical protein